MKIVLAPMEGVVDHIMRDLLTRQGGFDLCVTEFVRIVDQKLPERVFYRLCPELYHGCKTPSGTPVRIQLLGQDPNWLAENAEVATSLGSPGVDLNFGCPAKAVNKSKGGAVLLKEPETLYNIAKAVRSAVPEHLPVTAKMRLGYEDKSLAIENAKALTEGGISQLAIHARTKVEGYKPPAYWSWIKQIKQEVDIPIIANGEIWNKEHAYQCQHESDCVDLMLGRGALATPNLAAWIKGESEKMSWAELLDLLVAYSHYEIEGDRGLYYSNRVKQWLSYIRLQYTQADELFRSVRRIMKAEPMLEAIQQAQQQTNVNINNDFDSPQVAE